MRVLTQTAKDDEFAVTFSAPPFGSATWVTMGAGLVGVLFFTHKLSGGFIVQAIVVAVCFAILSPIVVRSLRRARDHVRAFTVTAEGVVIPKRGLFAWKSIERVQIKSTSGNVVFGFRVKASDRRRLPRTRLNRLLRAPDVGWNANWLSSDPDDILSAIRKLAGDQVPAVDDKR